MRIRSMTATTALAAVTVLGGAGVAAADDGPSAVGAAKKSPGVISGNVVQVPIHIPVNICGNQINVLALLNKTGNTVCVNR